MNRLAGPLALLLVFLPVLACDDSPAPLAPPSAIPPGVPNIADAPIQVAELVTLRVNGDFLEGQFEYTFENRTGSTLFVPIVSPVPAPLPSALPPALEKWVGGQWTFGFGPVFSLLGLGDLIIEPGETVVLPYDAGGGVPGSRTIPQFAVDSVDQIEGFYRMVWQDVRSGTDHDSPLPPFEFRVSNTFRIELDFADQDS